MTEKSLIEATIEPVDLWPVVPEEDSLPSKTGHGTNSYHVWLVSGRHGIYNGEDINLVINENDELMVVIHEDDGTGFHFNPLCAIQDMETGILIYHPRMQFMESQLSASQKSWLGRNSFWPKILEIPFA